MRPSYFALAALAAWAMACGAPAGGGAAGGGSGGALTPCHERPLTIEGTRGMPVQAQLVSNVFVLPVKLGASSGRMLFDTGAPITLGDPGVFTAETFPASSGPMKLEVGALRFPTASVVTYRAGLVLPDGPLGGIVGGDLLCHFTTRFDYRDESLTLGEGTLPMNLQAPVTVPSPIIGGGKGLAPSGEVLEFPPTRVLVTVNLEGTERTLVLDSGASYTVVTDAVFNALVADGRKVLTGLQVTTVMGQAGTKLARARTLSLGAAQAQGSIVATADTVLLASLTREAGRTVDGLLGGTFLREFLVSIDYAKGELTLHRYAERTHVKDEMVRAGVVLKASTSGTQGYEVGLLFPNTDAAAKGLKVGDRVSSIDGQPLVGMDSLQVDRLLIGTAGQTRTFGLLTGGPIQVLVEDLIALN